jgi:hypothetical protein
LDLEQKRIERMKAVGALQSSERAGLSLESLMSDYYRQEATYQNVARQNLSFVSTQILREQENLTTRAQGRIDEARGFIPAPIQDPRPPQPVQGPSLLGSALEFGSSALGTYSASRTYNPYSSYSGSLYQSVPVTTSTPSRFRIDTKSN